MAFYELRQYHVRPGKMAEWVKLMEEELLPFNISVGMVVTGLFRGETDDEVFVWLRRFENESERERLYEAFYESDQWKNQLLPKVQELIIREDHQIQRIVPLPSSVLQ